MIQFKKNKISEKNDIIASELRQAREAKNISLDIAAQKLQINISYLKALEEGEFNKLPDGVYGKNLLREYARYLNIESDKLLPLFTTKTEKKQTEKIDPFSRKIIKKRYFITIPKIIKNFIIICIALVCLGYLGYYLNNIISSPNLIIINPATDLTTTEKLLTIEGKAEPEIEITINEEKILADKSGLFAKTINLKTGLNNITITSKKKYSKVNTITRKIIVKEALEE